MNPTPARVLLILQLFFSVGSTHTLTDPSIGLLMQKIQKIITAMYKSITLSLNWDPCRSTDLYNPSMFVSGCVITIGADL